MEKLYRRMKKPGTVAHAIILAAQEAEIGRITVRGQPW
jgi:hypothetical protein